jgi:hypothetical protein
MLSFENKKDLKFVITLGTGKFGSSDNNQITLQGFRAIAEIDKAGGVQMGTLRAKIYGVSQSNMNSITTLMWRPNTYIPNTIQVYAIDGLAETLVFSGNIVNAWGDYQGMPDVYLHVQASTAFLNALKSVPPRSFNGVIDVATIMGQIASSMGYAFENNGVNVKMSNVYLANTGLEQAKELAQAAGIGLYIDDTILAITPTPYLPRGSIIPVISKFSGMVGYPTFDSIGVNFITLFNRAITFGGSIKIESDIKQAAGQWVVTSVSHRLESNKPGGAWFSNIRGNLNGLAVTQ